MPDTDIVMLFITVRGGDRPLTVLPLTQEQVDAKPGSMLRAKVRGAVECRDMRGAYGWANGFASGLMAAGKPNAPIYHDIVLATALDLDERPEHGGRADKYKTIHLDRSRT